MYSHVYFSEPALAFALPDDKIIEFRLFLNLTFFLWRKRGNRALHPRHRIRILHGFKIIAINNLLVFVASDRLVHWLRRNWSKVLGSVFVVCIRVGIMHGLILDITKDRLVVVKFKLFVQRNVFTALRVS